MATKVSTRAYADVLDKEIHPTVRVRIAGLRPVFDQDESDIYDLLDAEIKSVNYDTVREELLSQGVPPQVVDDAVCDMAEKVWIAMLARELAKRITLKS